MYTELSEIQKSIYFECLAGEKIAYNISVALNVKNVDANILYKALNLLTAEQESLRSRIVMHDNLPMLEIFDNVPVNFIVADVHSKTDLKNQVQRAMFIEFDLEKAPLYYTALINYESSSVLVVTMHHLISDGVSLDIFVRKLFEYYHNLNEQKPFRFIKNKGYHKFLDKENRKLNAGKYEKKRDYWKNALAGAEPLSLIPDYSFDNSGIGTGKERRFTINENLYKKLEMTARNNDMSLYMLMLGTFGILMRCYSANDDVVVSSSFSYRPNIEQDDSIGCYIYTLPLRFKFDKNYTFSDVMHISAENVFNAYKNIGYPNNLIARDVSSVNQMKSSSLFDVTFICDTYEKQADEIVGIYETETVTFPGNMMVIMQKIGNDTCIKFQYKPELFSEQTIDNMGQRFVKILEQLVENPEQKLDNIDLFINQEYEKILYQWNDSDKFPYTPQHIADVFEEQVELCPDKVTIISGDEKYTNREINNMANQLAHKLISLKKSENSLIGVQLERSFEMVVALLAILKAGCGYVPVDPSYPTERKNYIIKDASADILITHSSFDFRPEITVINVDSPDCFTGDTSNPVIERNPEHLAYVEYTSGSTGMPKGVMIENQSVINTVLDLDRRFPLKEDDVYLLKTTYAFDIFGTEFYGWIVGKGILCILEKDGEKNPETIISVINKYHVTHINFVPSMFRLFLETIGNSAETIKKLSSLKWIFLGGEAVTPDIIKRYFSLGIKAKLENLYGPTEATMWSTHYPLHKIEHTLNISIGNPLNQYRCYILDDNQNLLPVGVNGELYISGIGLARGYLNRDELTDEKFVANPFYNAETDNVWYKKMYHTGDLARWRADGTIEFLGRIDSQVKIGGIRIELGEIENALGQHENIVQAVAVLKKDSSNMAKICVYYTADHEIQSSELRTFLFNKIPTYMIPAFFVYRNELPLNTSGKVNRKLLSEDKSYINTRRSVQVVSDETSAIIMSAWQKVLETDDFGLDDNFFDIGGHSFAIIRVHNILKEKIDNNIPVNALIQYPTVRKLAEYISNLKTNGFENSDEKLNIHEKSHSVDNSDIAVIGIAVDVPGAVTVQDFWKVLQNGEETIHFYSDDELKELGISEHLINSPNYVKAKGRVDDLEVFDSEFFGISPKETDMTSPSLRMLYKGTWQVLEDSGYVPESFDGKIGVFLGGSDDFAWYRHALFNNVNYSDTYQSYTLSTNHFLATRLSYKFDFKGPALSALTGCSTSLVTAHLACRSLQSQECEMALAGGVTVEMPNEGGYMYESGMMFSPDGHCRPFDAKASGTVFSNGMALIALRRLDDAIRDKDHIYAVIKGSALNNDGSNKISYTAPSELGQIEVIREAYRNAGILPETVRYVEAHGTGTLLGDPIEVSSLTHAFATDKKQFCTLGSLKGNFGHTDTAAGIVGLSKVSLCLDKKFIPATVNYETPNPKVDFEKTPFIVKNYGEEWKRNDESPEIPLRAGINSFGVGGTNAHFVLEEAPENKPTPADKLYHILTFSAKTETALNNTIGKVLDYISGHNEITLPDIAFTLRNGRRKFKYQKSLAITEKMRSDMESIKEKIVNKPACCHNLNDKNKNVYFMFSGQGSQYQGMGRDIYYGDNSEFISRVFKKEVDRIFSCLSETQREEYMDVLYGTEKRERINQTKYTQFALFVTEYALAKSLLKLGIKPVALLGHSIGEVTASAIAGIWSLEDAVKIVIARGELMQAQKTGSMLAVMADVSKIENLLNDKVWVSLKNTSGRCVVGGSKEDIEEFEKILSQNEIGHTLLRTSHAFHTPMMKSASEKFEKLLETITFNKPQYPIISNVTGDYADNRIMTPHYWAEHIMSCVMFENDLQVMMQSESGIGIEIGAGRTLTTFASSHKNKKDGWTFINTIRHIKEQENDIKYIYESIGTLDFENTVNASLANIGISGKRVSLPSYVFDALPYPIIMDEPEETHTAHTKQNARQTENKIKIVISDISEMEKYTEFAYKEVFGFENIDMEGDFFAIGGDSLKAVSLAAVIKNQIGMNLDVNEVFAHSTPKRLAEYLFANYTSASQVQESIMPVPKQDYYVISSAQRRMYTMYLMDKETLAYNLPSATMISGGLEKERVIETVKKMIQRHELLRSSFEIKNGEVVQIIHDDIENIPVEFSTRKIDTEEDFQNIVNKFVRVFQLEKAPLFRMEIVDLGNNQQMLLFDVHHIIADGTSVEILTRDFNTLYFGELEPLTIQYKDFAFWQNENINSEKMQKQEEYWLNQLDGELPVLELPTDYARPEISKLTGKRVKFELDEKAGMAVNTLSTKYGATNFMVMLSAWYVLLAHYTAQEDIIIGTPVSGRTMEDIRETIGMFVNMLALRNYPESDKYYSDFLLEVKENTLEALSNQDYQFDTLVERINVQRKLNRNAVFDVSFDYHNMELHDLEINGMTFKSREIDSCNVSVDLVLTCYEENSHINGCIDYSTELFREETIERMISHYIRILSYLSENPDCRISEIPIVTENDMEIISRQFEKPDSHENNNILIHELFEHKATEIPDETALITSSGRIMTYAELNREANRIAWKLRENGIHENDCVGITAERNEELVISVLAVLKAGGTYTTIDTSYPYERIDYMIKQSGMKYIICSEVFSELAEKFTGVLYFNELCTGENDSNLPPVNTPESNAYIIFTSGSTGMPKGVMVKHSNVVNLITDHRNRNLFTDVHDRIVCIASPSFDIFVFETLIPLCCGGSLYMASREEQLDTVLLSRKMLEYNVTYIQAPVSRLRAMTENSLFKDVLPQLKVIVGGGETYPVSLVKYFQSVTPARLFNMYGPTETTVTATVKELTDSEYVTIGKPVENAQILILNENLDIQPVGIFGELCIAGEGVSNGYINNPEETKKRFISFNLTETRKILLYRTGDKARLLSNGEVELAGRIDNQVKIRGYRVELDEIEKTAMFLESVSYAVAKVFGNENGNTQLILFFSTAENITDTDSVRSEIAEMLTSRLPAYMMPSAIVYMKDMPVLNNGKIDRKALKMPQGIDNASPAVRTGNTGKQTKIESQIQNIWKEILNIKSISLKDNFFDIGGNSYTLMLVNNKLNDLLNRHIPLMTLFQYPTIESLAKAVSSSDDKQQFEDIPENSTDTETDIAVIGMSGKFPDAENIEEFWQNILQGKESITSFTEEELKLSGISPAEYNDKNYVNAKGYLENAEYFDADFFNYSHKEANLMDPQIRMLHMCVWNALEDAGYDPYRYSGKIGLFAGSSSNMAWMTKFLARKNNALSAFEAMTMNDKDFLTTKISYKLNLKGPSVNIQTACSTSLVAIHQAIKYLQCGETDIAVAGGVSITYPRKEGYIWNEGMIYSKDGHCRPFSDDSSGTVAGNGCAVVVLKKLSSAVRDNDNIYAVIKGSAINNDGIDKIGYTAPSISGESDVIRRAMKQAGFAPEDMNYIETHGTGTKLGDPIEIEALRQAWNTNKKNYCALGAVKANIGHLDAAAGATGFIKTVNVLKHHMIPPMVNFGKVNSNIDLQNSPFYISTDSKPIQADTARGAVSAFGIGGTNAHVVLEEWHSDKKNTKATDTNILLFSAKTGTALENTANAVMSYLNEHKDVNISDAAYTLQSGRGEFSHRKAVIISENQQIECTAGVCNERQKPISLIFPEKLNTISTDLYSQKDSLGKLFSRYADKVIKKLRFNDSHAIKQALQNNTADDETIRNMTSFVIIYSVLGVLDSIGISPDKICAENIGVLAERAFKSEISVADALNMIKNDPSGISELKNKQDCTNTDIITLDETEINTLSIYKITGQLWICGHPINWNVIYQPSERSRISLPSYVFDRTEFDSDISWNDDYNDSQAETNEISYTAMSNEEISETFAQIWAETLGREHKTGDDDFFALGGESFDAVVMTSSIHKKIHVNITLEEIVNLAKYDKILDCIISHSGENISGTDYEIIPQLPAQQYYQTSSAQKRMYTINSILGKNTVYNLGAVYHVDGKLDKERLKSVIDEITVRHESFRTSFEIINDEVVQIIHENVQSAITFENCSPDCIESAVKNAVQPFNLAEAPLMRVKFISVSDTEHYMVVDMHHIIADQSSMAVLMNDFYVLYAGGQLPDKNLKYVDFASWQNNLLKNGTIDRQLEYWKNEFSDGVPALNFPYDYTKTSNSSMTGKIQSFSFDPDLCKDISEWIKNKHITGYILMMTAFNMLLWKYADKKDFVIGTAFSGRKNDSLNEIIGMFVNTLPIRVKIDDTATTYDFLEYIRSKMFSALDAQDCQFDMLVDELKINNRNSENPLFDFIMNYVSIGTEEFEIDGLKLTPCVPETVSAKYDFTLTIVESNGTYQADIEYRTDLFCDESIQLFGKRLIDTIKQLIYGEAEEMKNFSLMTDEDKLWLDKLNQTATEIPYNSSISSLFEKQVHQNATRTAVVWQDNQYTYAQLDSMSNYLAVNLMESGLKAGDRVGLLIEEGIMQIVAILAVIKIGAVYIPMDCDYPADRIAYMMNDSSAEMVITQKMYVNSVCEDIKKFIISNTEIESVMNDNCTFNSPDNLSGEDETYIIYTSGSTGKPKGVIICGKSILRTVINTNYFNVIPEDKVLQMSNYTFDASVFNIFGTLLNGATLVIVPKNILLEMPKFAELIRNQHITKALIITAIFNMLVDYDASCLQSVDKIYIGGEALSCVHIRKALEVLGAGHLINAYGPTEAAVVSTYYEINQLDDIKNTIPIGKAISNTSLYVIDEYKNILPANMIGELCIGGIGLAKEYLNNPQITTDKFITLNNNSDERVYRTGDRTMMRTDGNVVYLGRIDTQIKLRGYRIELGEIEQCLNSIDGIAESAVISNKDSTGSVYISAYYTIRNGYETILTTAHIRKLMKQSLPEYMIPSRINCIDEMPITANGKIDKKALMSIKVKATETPVMEISRTAEIILDNMRNVLDNPALNASDDFFDNGGHSMKAILLVQRLHEIGIDIMVNDIMNHHTALELADLYAPDYSEENVNNHITEKISMNNSQICSVVKRICRESDMLSDTVTENEIKNTFSMTAVQKAHSEISSAQSGFTFIIKGRHSDMNIKYTIAELIVKHQLLHCTADMTEKNWNEWNVDNQESVIMQSIPFFDFTQYDTESCNEIIRQVFKNLMYDKYIQDKTPWRIVCFRLNENKVQVLWCFHHSVFDGMSAEILKRQLISALNNENIQDNIIPYEEYEELISQGAVEISNSQLIQDMDLKRWSSYNNQILDKMKSTENSSHEIRINIPVKDIAGDILGYTYNLLATAMTEYYQTDAFPMAVVNYGRKYKNHEFMNCVGEFLDVIPVVTSPDEQDIEKVIQDRIALFSEHNINFMHLLHNTADTDIHEYLHRCLCSGGGLNMMLYNFQGYISAEERRLFEEEWHNDEPASDGMIARLMMSVNYDDKNVMITILSSDGMDAEKFNRIISRHCQTGVLSKDGKTLITI